MSKADYSKAKGFKASDVQKYGKFEFRAKLPTGQGIWPALWMLPQAETYGAWASSGEIDVLEARGQEPTKVLGTIHYGSRWPLNTHASTDYILPGRSTIAGFHVYALEWEPGAIRWYVDGRRYASRSFWWSSSKSAGGEPVMPRTEGYESNSATFSKPRSPLARVS